MPLVHVCSETASMQPIEDVGGLGGNRTRDLQIKSPLLYRLSYEPQQLCERLP